MTQPDERDPKFHPPDEDVDHPDPRMNFGNDVTIKARTGGGVERYAVYDGEKQVSVEFGPIGEQDVIAFAEGYTARKSEES